MALAAKIAKSKTMTFQPGSIWSGMLEEAFFWCSKGEEDTYPERLKRRMMCTDFGLEIKLGYLPDHRRRLYGTKPVIDWERLPLRQHKHLPQVYEISFHRSSSRCQCAFLQGAMCCPTPEEYLRTTLTGWIGMKSSISWRITPCHNLAVRNTTAR